VRRAEDDHELLNIGKAYSGLTDLELTELTEWFQKHTIKEFAHGRVRLVQPSIVLEVTFDKVQPSNRHKSGFALRFPRIVRLRPDKSPEDIDTLETVRRLVEQPVATETPKP
jgi:DNA ligase-1